jgi:hypothetical protein
MYVFLFMHCYSLLQFLLNMSFKIHMLPFKRFDFHFIIKHTNYLLFIIQNNITVSSWQVTVIYNSRIENYVEENVHHSHDKEQLSKQCTSTQRTLCDAMLPITNTAFIEYTL